MQRQKQGENFKSSEVVTELPFHYHEVTSFMNQLRTLAKPQTDESELKLIKFARYKAEFEDNEHWKHQFKPGTPHMELI